MLRLFQLLLLLLDGLGVEKIGLFLLQTYQGVGRHKLSFEVGQRADTEVIHGIVIGLLVHHQRDEETQFADLYGNGLDVNTINAILNQIELTGVVGTVDALVEAALNVGHHLGTLLVGGIAVGFGGFTDGILHHNLFP